MIRGLVIGKFYPPHRGHSYLIDAASRQSDQLVVVVCVRPDQTIPGALRAQWLRERHPNAKVMVVADIGYDDDSKVWAEYTKAFLGYTPDVVFTSEDYGDAYARYLGCRHVLVDKQRVHVPISATAIRRDPLASWEFLDPAPRAFFAKRICVVGAESTGTTTLAKALAEHYRTMWVPEYGRFYSEGKQPHIAADHWESGEFTFIARMQNQLEDFMARQCNKLLICDTNSWATALWHERYMDHWSDEVAAIGQGRHYDLYLLTGDEIPFVQDGLRDGEHIRHAMQQRFAEELAKQAVPVRLLTGDRQSRLAQAIAACDQILTTPVFG